MRESDVVPGVGWRTRVMIDVNRGPETTHGPPLVPALLIHQTLPSAVVEVLYIYSERRTKKGLVYSFNSHFT